MTPRRLRPTLLGLFLGLAGLFLSGCVCNRMENVPEEVHAVAVQPLATPDWKLKVKKQTIIRMGERVCWKSRWKSRTLDSTGSRPRKPNPSTFSAKGTSVSQRRERLSRERFPTTSRQRAEACSPCISTPTSS